MCMGGVDLARVGSIEQVLGRPHLTAHEHWQGQPSAHKGGVNQAGVGSNACRPN